MSTTKEPHLRLSRNKRHGCWTLNGLTTGISLERDAEDVKDALARMICDNPSLQSALGILGSESFTFSVRHSDRL